jgi:hypothetical protein
LSTSFSHTTASNEAYPGRQQSSVSSSTFGSSSTHAETVSTRFVPAHSARQDDINRLLSSQNLTLRFFENSQEDSCGYSNSNRALTFTTSSIPFVRHCFDFADLFAGNATQGFVNQTRFLASGIHQEVGIHWQLENVERFRSQGNYSSVLYHQHIQLPSSDDQEPGHYADRHVTLYGGKSCSATNPADNETRLDWYGFSCWSQDEGSCGTVPYSVASFNLAPGTDDDDDQGTCWEFAQLGASARIATSFRTILGVIISTSLATWLAL